MIAFVWVAGGWALAAVFAPWWWLQVICGLIAWTAVGFVLLARAASREEARRRARETERGEAIGSAWLNHTFSPN